MVAWPAAQGTRPWEAGQTQYSSARGGQHRTWYNAQLLLMPQGATPELQGNVFQNPTHPANSRWMSTGPQVQHL